jgi:putative salt-induced outer membrane protein YdiY
MARNYSYFFIFLLFSCFVYSQNDSLSSKEIRKKRKKLIKYTKTKNYNDTLVLVNNNVLVGEFKRMDKSVITFKTKYSDSDFKIKWHKVLEIQSDRIFIISLDDGTRLSSSIHSSKKNKGKVILDSGVNAIEEDLIEIVALDPIGKNFLSRLTVDLDIGITLTKANNLKQLNSNLSMSYLANKWRSDGSFSTVLSRQDSIADISRMDGNIDFSYFLPNDWFAQVSAIYLSNDEQKLDLRSTYKAGMGYYFVHNSKLYLAANAGLASTKENYTDDTPTNSSAEMYIGLGFNKYDIGDLSLLTSASFYPSITEDGRFRADISFDMKYDLPWDFFIKMSVTYNYDNQPIEGASDTDYVFTTSFGWEFN